MTKAELEKKKDLARALFLSGLEQTEIADKVGVSRVTISKWCAADGWKEARAAKNITRPELVNKLLLTIDKLIQQVNESEDPNLISSLGDKLSKLASVIEYRAKTDPDVTPELIKAINKYQDKFLIESMSKGALA